MGGQEMTITEKLTENLYGKDIQVSLNDGTVLSGLWDGHMSELDNEPDGESILVKIESNLLVEVLTADIASIAPCLSDASLLVS
jgi:hypothetical protein